MRDPTTRGRAGYALGLILTVAACGGSNGNTASRGEQGAWHGFGHDLRNSRHNADSAITVEDASSLQERWRIDGLSGVTSTPAVAGDMLYAGAWNGRLYAVDTEDGSVAWKKSLGDQINGSPAVHEDRVYAVANAGKVYALNRMNGDTVWTTQATDEETASIDSSPVVADGMLFLGIGSYELTINKEDYSFQGSVVGLDLESGEIQWRVHTTQDNDESGAGVSVWSSAAVDTEREMLFIGTGQTYEEPASPRADGVIAIEYTSGDVEWMTQFTMGDIFTVAALGPGPDSDVGASPNLFRADGEDLVGAADKAGTYYALTRDDGEIVWSTKLTEASHVGGCMATAATDDTYIYVNSNRIGNVGAAATTQGSPDNASVTFALDQATGDIVWQKELSDAQFGAVTLGDGVLYENTIDGVVHALDAESGDELWTAEPGASLGGGVTVVGDTVYTGYGFWFLSQAANPKGGLVAYGPGG